MLILWYVFSGMATCSHILFSFVCIVLSTRHLSCYSWNKWIKKERNDCLNELINKYINKMYGWMKINYWMNEWMNEYK